MMWPRLWALLTRHRELTLAVAFVGMAAWEWVEVLTLELPSGSAGPLTVGMHSGQVLIVLGITWTMIRAWRQKTRHEGALVEMVPRKRSGAGSPTRCTTASPSSS